MKENSIVLNSYEEILVDFDVAVADNYLNCQTRMRNKNKKQNKRKTRSDEINRKVEQELLKINDMVGNSSRGSPHNYDDDSSHKTRLSLVITGHFDSPKSTTRGRLLYELGWLRREVHELAKESFLFVLCMDVCKDEH